MQSEFNQFTQSLREKPVFVCIVLKHQARCASPQLMLMRRTEDLPAPDFSVILKTFICPIAPIFIPIDPELIPGARNAINVCLRLKPEERITIITDYSDA